MNVQYERIDEIAGEELRPDHYYQMERDPTGPERRWPKVIGVVEIISGFVTAFLGAMEVFIVPMTDNIRDSDVIYLNKTNCYGAGILAGIMMILTGSTAIRASISKRASTVYRFYNLTMLTLVLYVAITIFLITGYGLGWTVKSNYPPNTHIHEVHIFVTVSTVLGLMFVTSAFVKYYDLVFYGEMQLAKKWLECLTCCFSRRLQQTEYQH
ncbi:uncharacterized protein LOC124276218 isoform X2 [Haliotis rubra]|uniref:uncharacterized protein LOC124276218 isoform X2 n=1 Tax=Haliotis rubra TaxID=36100 RepID=UPI001EE5728F|nr:uncharacterized protein LOC124276218 isoform X2 [Haliotis rubra]